jgi:hypothetical protein
MVAVNINWLSGRKKIRQDWSIPTESKMAVRKLLFRTEDGSSFIGDVIEYQDEFWLVPEWLEGPTKGTLCPARIICLSGLPTENPEPHIKLIGR